MFIHNLHEKVVLVLTLNFPLFHFTKGPFYLCYRVEENRNSHWTFSIPFILLNIFLHNLSFVIYFFISL